MRAPRIFRTTPFRLTLLFLALFAAAASAFLAYIYLATAGEVNRRADATISRELASLEAVYRRGGFSALNQAIIERSTGNQVLLYLLMDRSGAPISGSIARSPIKQDLSGRTWGTFVLADTDAAGAIVRRPARGAAEAMSGGERLFVGADVGDSEAYVVGIVRALWGAGALVLVLGLAGGILVPRLVSVTEGNQKIQETTILSIESNAEVPADAFVPDPIRVPKTVSQGPGSQAPASR